jgi:uncharacterized protein (TIRG00374 family)
MKRLQTALLAVGLTFLFYLVWKVGAVELWRQFLMLRWGIVPLILSEGVANLAHTIGWRHCLSRPQRSMSLALLFRIASAGFAINFLTPSASLGGEVAKGALLASHQRGPEATSSVLIDKLSGAMAHLVLVIVGSVFILFKVKLAPALWIALVVSNAVISAGVLVFFWLQRHGKLGSTVRWIARRRVPNTTLQKAASDLTAVDDLLKGFHLTRRKDLLLAVAWHVLGHSVGIFQTWVFLSSLGQANSFVNVATAGILCLWFDFATFAVPLNLGTLEGSRILALNAVGCSALVGMTYGVAQRAAQLSWSAFGLVNYLLLMRHRTEPRQTCSCGSLEAGL